MKMKKADKIANPWPYAPLALFVGSTYYAAPGWQGHRGQYATIEEAAVDGRKLAEQECGWWQVVDLRELKIVAGEGQSHTGMLGMFPAFPNPETPEHA